MSPEEDVKAAIRDALENEYEEIQIQGWVEDAIGDWFGGLESEVDA